MSDPVSALIDGALRTPRDPDGALRPANPSDLDDPLGEVPFAGGLVDEAVDAARRAQPGWEALGVESRSHALMRLRDVLMKREDELAHAIAREMGKVLREARAEAKALVAKVDISLHEGLALVPDVDLDARLGWRWRPHGVLAVLGPFNFPLHLPHGHIVPALLAGNTVVFKPSEVCPHTASVYARAALDAALPPGVLNVVQGDGEVGARLSAHPGCDGVLFTGSYAVGAKILAANAGQPGRMIALELGGKNAAVVLDDAPLARTAMEVALSAFSTAGQRCTCVSRLVVTRGIADALVDAVADIAARMRVGHAMDPEVFLGPLATREAWERFAAAQAEADREGSGCVREPVGPAVTWEGRAPRGHFVAPRVRRVTRRDPASRYQREEHFGPDLAVYVVDDLDEAVAVANDTPYGLAAGVWTASAESFEACAGRLRVGSLMWNAPTVGASSRLPFGGVGHSGNHRPAGVFSSRYCAWPLAITRGGADPAPSPAGITPAR
jgi:succinylglutamic semialdehyde dehydrogenase